MPKSPESQAADGLALLIGMAPSGASAKKRGERKEARAARPDGLDRSHDAERLDEWLAPEPERAVQMSLFGGRS